jgi:hypothetical protein
MKACFILTYLYYFNRPVKGLQAHNKGAFLSFYIKLTYLSVP